MRESILYFCTNDGTDARVSKEIKTLSKNYDIHFFGFVKNGSRKGEVLSLCSSVSVIQGGARSIPKLLAYIFNAICGLLRHRASSIHVVDEELLILLYPFLLGRRVVLDIFDSLLLRLNRSGEKWILIKRILYSLPKAIIVTDSNRKTLLPAFVHNKTVIVPNAPSFCPYPSKNRSGDDLTIYLVGSLSKHRGASFARNLLLTDEKIKIIAAGWIYDDCARDLIAEPRVEYLGVLSQEEINTRIAVNGDYILAIYPLSNQNNINASPNKIFDAIHTRTPIIISSGTYASRMVNEMKIGVIVDSEDVVDFSKLCIELRRQKNEFHFNQNDIEMNSWDRFEPELLKCHDG